VLTLVTVILLPSTVLAGIMGMNFEVGFLRSGLDFLDGDRRDVWHRRGRTRRRPRPSLDLIAGHDPGNCLDSGPF
jgi:hypothetical protein